MALISLQEISLAFGGPLVFDELSLQLEPGERVALLGRNGVGKTTLMKVMAGQLGIDRGEIVSQKGIQVTHLAQEVPLDIKGTVFDIVLSGLGKRAELLSDYHHVSLRLHTEHTPELMRQLDVLQSELDRTNGWDINNQVEEVISRMKLDPESDFEKLSGGQRRRVFLAKALVLKPEVLLLDEPTNHLDIDSINWLEDFLRNYPGTIFFVTHDRVFMTHLATRIIELDRGRLFSWACDYKTFLERKKMVLEIEKAQRLDFDKKLSDEEVWIRKGVKARRVRNEGRVKALERLRKEKQAQRQAIGQARIQSHEADPSGHLVLKASHLGFSYGENCLIRDFSTQIMRGDKIGVIGPNGCGKTTLLRILLGELLPQKGKVRFGTKLEVAYYDQLREQLDEEKTVIQNVCGENDTIVINGKPRHIIGYLQNFLFSADRARTPVKVLSGGERNRLLLARLFTKPSNLLVMDEPTNDLDIETLELLEELLLDYSGTLLLVSHDRAFLNNIVTSMVVLEGNGGINEYTGGYDDWLNQRKSLAAQEKPKAKVVQETVITEKPSIPRKLSFKEERELEKLPITIEKLEAEQDEIYTLLADVNFYQRDAKEIAQAKARLEAVEDELLRAFQRWAYLDGAKEKDS
jgi:ATP-binding cassette subfamily F protein uup